MAEVKATIKKADKQVRDSNHTAVVGNSYPSPHLANLYVVNNNYRSQDMNKWKQALDAARNNYTPRRDRLQDLYEDIYLDPFLQGLVQKRINMLTNKRFKFYNADGTENKAVQLTICDTPWFRDMLAQRQLARFFGASVVEFILQDGWISGLQLVPRQHVVPEKGVILKQVGDTLGYSYLQDPIIKATTLPLGKPDDFGLLLTLARMVIGKRGVINDALIFSEMFGKPYRVAKYPLHDNKTRDTLNNALATQGATGYVVIPQGAEIDFKNAPSTGATDIFKELGYFYDEQMSVLVLGNTMTTRDGASKAQGEVHERAEYAIMLSDVRDAEDMLNYEFRERLLALGAPVAQGQFKADLTEQLGTASFTDAITKMHSIGLPIPTKPLYDKLGLPMPDDAPEVLVNTQLDGSALSLPDNTDNPGQKTLPTGKRNPAMLLAMPAMRAQVDKYYGGTCCGPVMETTPPISNYDSIMERLATSLFNGDNTVVDTELLKQTAADLLNALTTGFKDVLNVELPSEFDERLYQYLQNNIYKFSGAKTYQQLVDMRNLLVQDGAIRSLQDFKQAVLTNINPKYNQAYLATEYNTTLATATEAARWKTIQDQKDILPYLRWNAVLDDRTADLDRSLDGKVIAVGDSVLQTYYPPLHYNCRCTLQQITADEAATLERPDFSLIALPPEPFRNNAAITGNVWVDEHPYFSGIDKKAQTAINKAIKTVRNE